MAIPTPKIVNIYGNNYQPKVGSYVLVDNRPIGERLLPGSDYVDNSFPGCQFYYPISSLKSGKIACNVEITGRTKQKVNGAYYIKVQITWVHDGEPNTTSSGWMLAD